MKTYKIKVTFKDGSYNYYHANQKKIQKKKNVIEYIFSRHPSYTVREIKTRMKSETTGKYYWELNYNQFFEYAKENHIRIEATNAPGYEDITGYGSTTNGKKNRFYIGRLTGWIPIYLEILTNRSTGGGVLFTHKRTFKYI